MKLLMNHKAILFQAGDEFWIMKTFISLTMQMHLFLKFSAVLSLSPCIPSTS